MKKFNENKPSSGRPGDREFYPALDISWSRSKEEVWSELSRQTGLSPGPDRLRITARFRLVAAAVVVLLIGASLFARFYGTTVTTPAGVRLTRLLPDGSAVEMNAGSTLRYKPLWWYFNREVRFEGEAFFKVKNGKSFTVQSGLGRVTVLGTTFNVFARDNRYAVTCFSGKVRVEALESGHSVDLVTNHQASLNRDGSIRMSRVSGEARWLRDEFFFTQTPLRQVFDEIERQYGIRIATPNIPPYLYTGNFSARRPVEEVLQMVCKPYGLKYRKANGGYIVEED